MNINDRNTPIQDIIDMAKKVANSGCVGQKGSKSDAERQIDQLIGGNDKTFTDRYGLNYWNYLKATLKNYAKTRGLEEEFVVKASPFNWHDMIGCKCSAVILRKDYCRGEHRIEPELFLDVGVLTDLNGAHYPGVAYGFHYLQGVDGNESKFVKGVLEDKGLRAMIFELANNGFQVGFKPGSSQGINLSDSWNAERAFITGYPEKVVPSDLENRIFLTFDELLPFYRGVISL